MINDLKQMNLFLLTAVILLLAFSFSLGSKLAEETDRADKLAAQVYTLGSMLGEIQSAHRAESTIAEVSALD